MELRQLLRTGASVLTFLLLAPIPVYALSFGTWSIITGDWTDTGSTGGATSILYIQPSTGSTASNTTATFTFQVPVTFTVNGNNGPFGDPVAVTASNLNALYLNSGVLTIQAAVLIPIGGGTFYRFR